MVSHTIRLCHIIQSCFLFKFRGWCWTAFCVSSPRDTCCVVLCDSIACCCCDLLTCCIITYDYDDCFFFVDGGGLFSSPRQQRIYPPLPDAVTWSGLSASTESSRNLWASGLNGFAGFVATRRTFLKSACLLSKGRSLTHTA